MQRMLLFFLFVFIFPLQGFAEVRNSDNRYYVSDEMWKQEPYNKFVRLTKYRGLFPVLECTAQYVSHNLILSAGHCVKDDKGRYKIENYKKQTIPVELIYNACGSYEVCTTKGNYLKGNDWAIWRINEKKYYNDDFFNTFIPTHNTKVINAGYGNLRILTDAEIKELRKMLQDIHAQQAHDSDVYNKLSNAMGRKGMKGLSDDNLKASKCNLDVSYSYYPGMFNSDCYGWGGNSGGGVVSETGEILYGILVAGAYTFDNQSHVVTSPRQFQSTLQKLIVENGGTVTNVEKDNSSSDIDSNTSEERDELGFHEDIEEDVLDSNDIADIVNNFEADIQELENNLDNELSNVSDMDDASILNFLDKTVELGNKKEKLEELQKAYEEAKAREQSIENRALTALTVAATGIGGMELARGLAEQKADKEAERAMEAYIATFRCEYGNGKSVKGGMTEIELPGGNDETLMKLRNEYFTLANGLKERKEALGIKPGIESEVILDKAQIGLYDNENTGITGGAYSSLYRAKMLDSEIDQTKIDEDKEKSEKRVIAGGVLSGVGVAGGMIGNSLINGKLGEMIKDSKNTTGKTNTSVINKFKKGLKSTGMTGVD